MKNKYPVKSTLGLLLIFLAFSLPAQSIWPGDIDNNGKVSAVDVLYAGVAFGSAGAPRANASGDWEAQQLTMDWMLEFEGINLNYAYADADGDGFVGDNDIFGVVRENFGKSNTLNPGSEGYLNGQEGTDPQLVLKPVHDTVAFGSFAEFEIQLGDATRPVPEFYGISFLMSFSSNLAPEPKSMNIGLRPDAWVDPTDGAESRVFFQKYTQGGKAEVAITRINQTSVPNGQGIIGSFFILIEDVGSFLPANDTLIITIDSVRLIKNIHLETQPVVVSQAMVMLSGNPVNNPTPNCPDVVAPVCGSNGVTYLNSCYAEADGIFVYTPGVCFSDCINPDEMFSNANCGTVYDPVCGCNGVTYINECFAEAAGVSTWTAGKCPDQGCYDPQNVVNGGYTTVDPLTGIITMNCPADSSEPVCGCDGITYPSACVAEASGVTFYTAGQCGQCVEPAQMNPDTLCPYVYDPVCGCNDITYMNACMAEAAGVVSYTPGPCSGSSIWCDNATPIQCGDFLPYEKTTGLVNKISNYPGCLSTPLVGPEKVYVLNKTTPGDLQIGLEITTPNLDLDLFLLKDDCSQVQCLASSTTSNALTNNEGILYEDAPIGTYYIVVDGQYATSAGEYRLEVSCGYLSCYNAPELECGVAYAGSNIGGNDDVSLYKCGNTLNVENNGPEVVHTFTITEPGEVEISLTGLDANLELFLLKDCDASACLKYSQNGGTSDEYIKMWLQAGTYYVVVDGYNGAVSDYKLEISCAAGCDVQLTLSSTNASCGQSDGSITATSVGGVPPFWVSWTGPVSGNFTTYSNSCTIHNLPPGTYWVTKTDLQGCSVTESVVIEDSGDLTAQITPIHATCNSMGMGKLTVNIGTGQGPFHVVLSGPSPKNFYINNPNFTINSLSPGNYILYIIDPSGCVFTDNFAINNTTGINFDVLVTNASCSQLGGLTIQLNNGAPPYWVILGGPVSNSFLTYNNQLTIPNLPGGVYQIVVEDNNWCQGYEQVTILTDVLDVTATPQSGVCGVPGGINVHINNGTGPYQINWSGPVTGSVSTSNPNYFIPNLPSGSYSITTTDAFGCTDYQLVTIDNSANNLTMVLTAGNGQCGNTGFIWIDVYNGTAPFTLSWTGPSSGDASSPTPGMDITNLPSGCYVVTVTDANGCSDTQSICLQNDPPLTVTAQPVNGNCGQPGKIVLNFLSGTPNYLVNWTGPTSGGISTNANTYQLNNLPSGTYTLQISDGSGCLTTKTVVIDNSGTMTIGATAQPGNCGQPGAILVSLSGGNGPYSVSWSGPVFGSTTSNNGTLTIPNLPSGVYTLSAFDSGSCYAMKTVTLTNNPNNISINATPNPGLCTSFGSISVNVSGSVSPITITWNGPVQGTATVSGNTYQIPNLPSGNYTIQVNDNAGCSANANASLQNGQSINLTAGAVNGVCGQPGKINLTITGGTAPYGISWTGAQSGFIVVYTNTYSIQNLPSGDYQITVADANNCSDMQTAHLNNVAAINLSTVPFGGQCGQNGQILVNIAGGLSPYTIEWTGPVNGTTSINSNNYAIPNLPSGVYTITVTGASGCSEVEGVNLDNGTNFTLNATQSPGLCGQNGAIALEIWGATPPYQISWTGPVSGSANTSNAAYSIDNLPSGTYSIQVTDASGCANTQTFTLTNGAPATLSLSPQNGQCGSYGSIDVQVLSGTPPYVLSWSGAANSSTTVTTNSYTISGLPSGTFSVQIIDYQGCTFSTTTQLNNGSSLALNANPVNGLCGQPGSIQLSISGAPGPKTITWSGPVSGTTAINNSTYTIPGLPSGTYSVSITDSNGCTASQGVVLSNGTSVSLSAVPGAGNCGQNGSIYLTISGGSTPFSLTWTGPTSGTTSINTLNYTLSDLPAGNYTLNITDNAGCTGAASALVTAAPALSATVTASNAICDGASDGTATANPVGGTPPFSYQWNTGANTATISNLGSGTYSVTITDANNCTAVSSATIVSTQPVFLDLVVTNVLCAGDQTGAIYVTGWGGTPNFTYYWSDGTVFTEPSPNLGSTLSGLAAGTYGVTVVDQNGCSDAGQITVEEPQPLLLTTTVVNANCNSPSGSATVNVTGGTTPYNYLWDTGSTSPVLSGVQPGTYAITVTDGHACTATTVATIGTDSQMPVAGFNANPDVLSVNFVNTSSGNPVSFFWEFGDGTTSTDANPAYEYCDPGTYDVCLTVVNACGTDTHCETISLTIPANTVILDVGDATGAGGSTVAVPVSVDHLSTLVSLAGSLQLSDPFVGTITGVVPAAIAPNFGAANNTFSYFEPSGNGIPVLPGEILFYVAVQLTGNPGDVAHLIIWDNPLPVEVGGKVNGAPVLMDHVELKGTVTVAHFATVGGAVYTFKDEAVGLVEVTMENNQFLAKDTTGSDGNYGFSNVPFGFEYVLSPRKDTFPGNGLSTFSLFLGQQFLLGMNPPAIWSPYQVIAGDANCNGTFTTFDLFLIQQVILGMEDKFSDCPSWVFVPEHFNFPTPFNAYNVFPHPTADTLIVTSDTTVNFIGVKKGDILGQANPLNLTQPSADDRGADALRLRTQEVAASAGETIELAFTSDNFTDIVALQMGMTLQSDKIEYVSFEGNALNSVGVGNPKDNELRISWFDLNGTGLTLDSSVVLFTLRFTALEPVSKWSDLLQVGIPGFSTEANTLAGEALAIELVYDSLTTDVDEKINTDFYLYENVPNPFTGVTRIPFDLPRRGEAEIIIQNALGETVERIRDVFDAGRNVIRWEPPNLSSGIYFYTLKSGNYQMTRKMIKL